jgi:hypothetical protein
MNVALAATSLYAPDAQPKARLFDLLAGSWRISRTIDPHGALDGTATFTERDGGWLAYSERGELTVDGGRFTARRSYLFEPRPDGFAVWFDGQPRRLFHEIVLDGEEGDRLMGSATHLCRDDLYLSLYRFEPGGVFTIRHRVTGPNKDYTVTTNYTRLPEAA